jgi:prophage regulatory protein
VRQLETSIKKKLALSGPLAQHVRIDIAPCSPFSPQHLQTEIGSMENRLLKLPEVLRITGMGKSSLMKLLAVDMFPRSFRVEGLRNVRWSYESVHRWMEEQEHRASNTTTNTAA